MRRAKSHLAVARQSSSTTKKSTPVSLSGSVLIPLILICVLGTLAYVNSLHSPFVFDDGASVERNPGVRFGDYLSDSPLQMRLILYMTFALNHRFGGMDAWGYHLINLLLHLMNGVLVFFITRRIFQKVDTPPSRLNWFAGCSAALFLVHPLQTESVTYVSSRSELLSTLFYALAFLLFISWPERKIGFALAAGIALLFGLGLVSKETVITLPAALLLYDFIFISAGSFASLLRRWRFYIVFLVLGLTASIYLVLQWNRVFKQDPSLLSPWHYFLTETRVVVRYIELLVFPVGLNLDYDFRVSTTILDPSVLFGLAVLIAMVAVGIYWRRNHPLLTFAIFWFLITLAPTSSFAPIQDVIFEHRLYLPLVGICLLFPALIRQRLVASAVLALLLIGTVYRNYTWGDEVRLYTDIVSKSPGKARAYNALTLAYAKRGQTDQAINAAKAGLSTVPPTNAFELYTILGNLYLQTGQFDEAIEAYKKSLGGGDLAVDYNNLGVAYLRQWQQLRAQRNVMADADFQVATQHLLSQAEAAFLESYHRDRSNLTSLDSYIQVRFDAGSASGWKPELQEILAKEETFDTLYSLGKIEWLENDFAEAAKYFARAVHLNSDQKLLHYNYAYALGQTNRTDDAIEQYLRAIRIDPTFWEAHFNVALLYMKNADAKDAIAHFDEVLRLSPGHPQTLLYLARLFIQQNEPARARPYLQEVLRINPQNPEALSLWQRLGS